MITTNEIAYMEYIKNKKKNSNYLFDPSKIKSFKRSLLYNWIMNHYFTEDKTIQEFGSGDGLFLDIAKAHNKTVIGYDLSKEKVFLHPLIKLKDFRKVKTKSDGLFCANLMEHVNHDELYKAFVRCCNNTLVVLTQYPTPHFWDSPYHLRPYTPKTLLYLNTAYGFRTILTKRITGSTIMSVAKCQQ